MTDESQTPDRLGPLMDEFVERFRRGERPSLTEFVQRQPDLEDDIRELFPALVMMEHADGGPEQSANAHRMTADGRELTQLGDYRILREIGRGGMGIIYEALQESLGRHVALKVLPWNALLNPTHLQRFQREARVAAALHHTNIVPVFGVGAHEGVHFYAMQFIRGQSLDNVLIELRLLRRGDMNRTDRDDERLSQSSIAGSLLTGVSAIELQSRAGNDDSQNVLASRAASAPGREPNADRPGANATRLAETRKAKPIVASSSAADAHSADCSSGSLTSLSDVSGSAGHQHYFRRVAEIGAEVADALAYAHSHDVLHRDIKPSNLMIDIEGAVWVTDFGLARASLSSSDHVTAERGAEDITHTGDLIGTLRYMAPERFHGQADVRSDLYSLGLTLYEMLTLQTAFDATDRVELIRQVTHEAPIPPRRVDVHIPRDLETIVLKAIARDPATRYQTAAELSEDLRRFLADRPIVARRTPLRERVVLWCRRNPVVAALLAVVATLLLMLGAEATYSSFRLAEQDRSLKKQAEHVTAVEKAARRDLYAAHFAQVRAALMLPEPGRRDRCFQGIRSARELVSALDSPSSAIRQLRDELLAGLPLFDVRLDQSHAMPDDAPPIPLPAWGFDSGVTRYAHEEAGGQLVVRRINDNREVIRLPGVGPFVRNLHRPTCLFSRDDRLLAVRGRHPDGVTRVQIWNLESRRLLGNWNAESTDSTWGGIVFSPDGRELAFVNGPRIDWFDLATERIVANSPIGHTSSYLSLSPDGTRIAVSGTEQRSRPTERAAVLVVDRHTGEVKQTLPHADFVLAVAWSRDGRSLASACLDQNAYVWDLEQPAVPQLICRGHSRPVTHVAFSPNADLLLTSGTDLRTRIWSAKSGEQLLEIPEHYGVRFSADGRWLGCSSPGRRVARFEIVDGAECRTLTFRADAGAVRSLDFSPDGQRLAISHNSQTQVVAWNSGEVLNHRNETANLRVRFADDNEQLLIAGMNTSLRRLPVLDLSDGAKETKSRIGPPEIVAVDPPPSVSDFDLSADGRRMAVVLRHQRVLVFDPQQPQHVIELIGHKYVERVALSPDARWAATVSSYSDDVRVWDVTTGRHVHSLAVKRQESGGLAFSPDGNWFVTLLGDHYAVHRVATWDEVARLPHEITVGGSAAFSPDGSLLAVTDVSHVNLIDTVSWQELARLPVRRSNNLTTGSQSSQAPLCFDRTGTLLAVGTMQGTVQIWNLPLVRRRLAEFELDWSASSSRPGVLGAHSFNRSF